MAENRSDTHCRSVGDYAGTIVAGECSRIAIWISIDRILAAAGATAISMFLLPRSLAFSIPAFALVQQPRDDLF